MAAKEYDAPNPPTFSIHCFCTSIPFFFQTGRPSAHPKTTQIASNINGNCEYVTSRTVPYSEMRSFTAIVKKTAFSSRIFPVLTLLKWQTTKTVLKKNRYVLRTYWCVSEQMLDYIVCIIRFRVYMCVCVSFSWKGLLCAEYLTILPLVDWCVPTICERTKHAKTNSNICH